MKETQKIKLGISVGDLNGVGCEVILKTFKDSRMLEFCTPILFAATKTISQQKNLLGLRMNFHGIEEASKALAGKINIVTLWRETPQPAFGQATAESTKYALKSLHAAVTALKDNAIDVLVTAPINTNNTQDAALKFPGHNHFLAQQLQGKPLTLMVSDSLRVGLLTDHIPIKNVASTITPQLVHDKVALMEKSLKIDFGIRKPKIAVLSINPHHNTDETIGEEDNTILKPGIEELLNQGTLVHGPYAADNFFGTNAYTAFDGVLAAYHDQGLIPFKTLSFGKGVHYTAGLNKVCTAPEHGTVYDIAGKAKADESSFKQAVFTAIQVYRNRLEHREVTKNPLQKQKAKTTKPKT